MCLVCLVSRVSTFLAVFRVALSVCSLYLTLNRSIIKMMPVPRNILLLILILSRSLLVKQNLMAGIARLLNQDCSFKTGFIYLIFLLTQCYTNVQGCRFNRGKEATAPPTFSALHLHLGCSSLPTQSHLTAQCHSPHERTCVWSCLQLLPWAL